MPYLIKTPWWVKKYVYPSYTWSVATKEKKIFLSFDDGPHPIATPFVLDELKKYNAFATFFCVGKNVQEHTHIYNRILNEGHAVGNHTQHHLNGWQVSDKIYFDDIAAASKYIDSGLFRPPYGKITRFQAQQIQEKLQLKIVMWSTLSADFDARIKPERCWENVRKNTTNGEIVVFHDSEKAYERMAYTLPKLLNKYSEEGYKFEQIKL
jgi:peptidoglycan-N-acetylglucosamine deacetylase